MRHREDKVIEEPVKTLFYSGSNVAVWRHSEVFGRKPEQSGPVEVVEEESLYSRRGMVSTNDTARPSKSLRWNGFGLNTLFLRTELQRYITVRKRMGKVEISGISVKVCSRSEQPGKFGIRDDFALDDATEISLLVALHQDLVEEGEYLEKYHNYEKSLELLTLFVSIFISNIPVVQSSVARLSMVACCEVLACIN